MEELFWGVLHISVLASFLILLVMLFHLPVRKMKRSWMCLLWMLVAIRLVCPVSLEIPVAIALETETAVQTYVAGWREDNPVVGGADSIQNDTTDKTADGPADHLSGDEWEELSGSNFSDMRKLHLTSVLPWIWLAGVLFLFVFCAGRYLYISVVMRESIRWKENIRLSDRTVTPFTMGFFKPRIYLPSDVTEPEMEYIVSHEKTHIAGKDAWWSAIGMGVVILHWFNPLVWAAYHMFCNDLEYACDEKVVRGKNLEYRKEYSRILLKYSTGQKKGMRLVPSFADRQIKKRIGEVLKVKKTSYVLGMVIIGAVALAAVFSFTKLSAGEQKQDGNHAEETDGSGAGMYEKLSTEQKEYLENEARLTEEEINGMSYENVNNYLLGTGLELYNPSSGAEKYGVTYTVDGVTSFPEEGYYMQQSPTGAEMLTFEQLYELRLKDTDMRVEDFLCYQYEMKKSEEKDHRYFMWLPLEGCEKTYAVLVFDEQEDGTIKMKVPYIKHYYEEMGEGKQGMAFSVLYDQDLIGAYFENGDCSLEDKLVYGIQYNSVTDHSLVVRISNYTQDSYTLEPSIRLFMKDEDKETLVYEYTASEESEIRAYCFSIEAVELTGSGESLAPGRYRLEYGRNEPGYIYCELEFTR